MEEIELNAYCQGRFDGSYSALLQDTDRDCIYVEIADSPQEACQQAAANLRKMAERFEAIANAHEKDLCVVRSRTHVKMYRSGSRGSKNEKG